MAAPAATPRRLQLGRADYCELSMLGERVQRLEHEAREAMAAYAAKIAAVRARRDALLERLGQQHDFNHAGTFRLEDEDHALIILETTSS